jgi:hypothetical protein
MACPPFSEILMVSQNVRSGGDRQQGSTDRQLSSPKIGAKWKINSFFVEKNKPALHPWQNTDFFRFMI